MKDRLRKSLQDYAQATFPKALLAPFGGQWICALDASGSLVLEDDGLKLSGFQASGQDLPRQPSTRDLLDFVEVYCRTHGVWAVGWLSYEGFEQASVTGDGSLGWPRMRFDFYRDPEILDLPFEYFPSDTWQGLPVKESRSGEDLQALWPQGRYAALCEEIRQLIRKGDCYQVNLVQRFSCSFPRRDALALFAALRSQDPSIQGYRALLEPEAGRAIVSDSPELFLERQGMQIGARPIKGTLSRKDDPGPESLLSSRKDRAELAMIVDLLRNDLGRCCKAGSVRVGSFPELIELPTLYHTCADVRGELKVEATLGAILQAAFPCGSITGCPKSRAVQRIRELEMQERGPMMGAIGYLAPWGDFRFSVSIRTALLEKNALLLAAGGGITWDSDPHAEEEESQTKTHSFERALNRLFPSV